VDLDPTSDCRQPRFGQCAGLGPPRCIDQDAFFAPPVCTAWRTDFVARRAAVYTPSPTAAPSNSVRTALLGHRAPPDADSRAPSPARAQREASKYLDVSALRVFKGFNRCKKLFGLVNCCNRGSTLQGCSAICRCPCGRRSAGRAAFSSYTYDALFTRRAAGRVVRVCSAPASIPGSPGSWPATSPSPISCSRSPPGRGRWPCWPSSTPGCCRARSRNR
jgi:hypothetical protein